MNKKQMVRWALLLPLFFMIVTSAWAQKTVSGQVKDDKGVPVSGATVMVKGSKSGTATDANGNFKITVPEGATIVITSVGFATAEVSAAGDLSNIQLAVQNSSLNEVVVVGYGTRKVKDATGSVAQITTKDFNKGAISSPEQLIQGRTPGVSITPSSGEPGAAPTITIRGTSSIRGNQEPLYVIDGVPIGGGGSTGSASGVEGSTTAKNPLIFLNPADIESITILKDASSAAIYGSRAANGVILVTTKNGKGGKPGFQFSATTGVASTASRYDLLNAEDFLLGVKAANILGGTSPEDAAEAVANVDKGASTDWQDQIFQTGLQQSYNLSWGFGKKSNSLRLSGGYDNQEGTVKGTGLERLTFRGNYMQKLLDDKLSLETNLTFSNTKNTYGPISNNAGYQGSLIGAALIFNPTYPVFDDAGDFYDPKDGSRNPAEMLAYFDDRDKINRFLGNVSLTYKLAEGLSLKGVLGYDKAKAERNSFADPRLSSNAYGGQISIFNGNINNTGIEGNGRATRQNLDYTSILTEGYLTYDKTFNNGHVLNAVAGVSYQNFETVYGINFGWGLATPVTKPTDVFVKDFDNFTNYATGVPDFQRNELQSGYVRLNYSIAEKYYLTGTFRADGSSRFGENNRYGYFPAFAVKWRIIREAFAEKALGDLFSDLSIRANFGIIGSQDGIPNYAPLDYSTVFQGPNDTEPQRVYSWEGNPDLRWEQARTLGAAIDFAIFKSRLTGTVEYFNTNRKDLLYFSPIPGGYSASTYRWDNLPGFVRNTGVEVSLNIKVVNAEKFKWDVNYNMTFQKNEVVDLNQIVNTGQVNGQGLTGAFAQTITDGSSLFTWKMPVFQGFDGNGNARYADGGKDQLVGSALPTFFAGLTNTFSIGRLSASVFMNAVTGFKVYNNTANALFLKGSLRNARNVTYDVAEGPESPINPGSVSTRFLEEGDFLRLSNVTLSYAFNVNGKSIRSLSIFATGQNLALFTNYSGLDPEVNVDKQINGIPSRGFDYTAYPPSRIFTFGLNLGF
jgi:iron complex outermembrane receptor protein